MLNSALRSATVAAIVSSLPLLAFAQAPAPTAAPPPQAAAQAQAAAQYSINQNVGDWVVRCVQTNLKTPAPCEVLQVTINKDTKQRLSSLSIAFVPSRDAYAMQVVVPTGVALAKGLMIGTSPNGMKFTRCEQDGCYVEAVVDGNTVQAIGKGGTTTDIAVVPYGKTNQIKFPVSLTGFTEAIDRMKSYSKDRAVALPLPAGSPAAAPPRAAAAKPAARK